MPSRTSISQSTMKVVWGKSGGCCAMCCCALLKETAEEATRPIGQMAHIKGERPGSARYDSAMSDEERSAANNLILLCPTDHSKIDTDPSSYPVEELEKLKQDHEAIVLTSLKKSLQSVTFKELRATINYLATAELPSGLEEISVIPPKDKIQINRLSSEIANLIRMGLSQQTLVSQYLRNIPDFNFPERLKQGFVIKYQELKESKKEPDVLFYELLDFASCNYEEKALQAAGLVVLSYFFETCDVFEHATTK